MVADVPIFRDLYLTYFLMVLESFNYFSTSLLFVLYLTQEFGVSDIEVNFFAMSLMVLYELSDICKLMG